MQIQHRAIQRPFKGHSYYVSDALCLTGDAHASLVTNPDNVTCPNCKKLQKKLRLNREGNVKLTLGEINPHI